jgi:hypothetical protein
MRIGNNPEKGKDSVNVLKRHRVVVVFYVPDSGDAYFAQLAGVLDKCLDSLIRTINPETTCVTLVDNNSGAAAKEVAKKYKPLVDKYVEYRQNKGKVYAVLNEVRGVYEPFVTIADADILFFGGWEQAVFDVFDQHPYAGVVSPHPCPYTTFYFNKLVFGLNTLTGNIARGKFVDDADIDLYIKGTNLPKIIERKGSHNWKEKQLVLKRPSPAVIGAYHVVATYRTAQFRNVYTFPEVVFRNSYEEFFIDCLADRKGLYRLSTLKTYVYHMGNTLDDVTGLENENLFPVSAELLRRISTFPDQNAVWISLKRYLARAFVKFIWNR